MIFVKKEPKLKKNYPLFCVFIWICTLFFSCKSTPNKLADTTPEKTSNTSNFIRPTGEGTVLSLPDKRELNEKRLDAKLIANVEKGSPESLKAAVLFIQNDSKGFTRENKIYLKIITDIMYLVYPQETEGIRPQDSQEDDEYLTGLKSIKNGIYPFTMKKNDFLSLIIPTLILTKNLPAASINRYKEDIEQRLAEAKKLRAESVLPYYIEGLLREKENNETEAEKLYKTAWDIDNSCYPAGLKYGRLAALNGNGNTAIEIADILSRVYKNNAEIYILYTQGCIANKNLNKASEYIVDVLKKDPDNIYALLLRIQILIEQGEYLKANALLDAYSLKNRTSKEYFLFRARLAKEWSKNIIAAADFLTEAYRFHPDDFSVLLECAEICLISSQKIDNKPADFFIQKILQKDTENAAALSLLVRHNIVNENWKEAVSIALKLINKAPENSNKELLITACLGAGNFKEAAALSKQLYSETKNPSNSVIKLYLQALYKTANYNTMSQIIKEKINQSDSELKSIFHYYNAKLSQDNRETYLSSLRASLLANPRNKEALFAMYEFYFKAKDYRKAKYYLGQVIALEPSNKKNMELSEKLEILLAN